MRMLFLVAATLFCALNANAEYSETVTQFTKINFDGKNLDVAYTFGGGCQKHQAILDLTLTQESEKSFTLVVNVLDVTAEPDYCKAIKNGQLKVNLNEAIIKALEKNDIPASDFTRVKVILPVVNVLPYRPTL